MGFLDSKTPEQKRQEEAYAKGRGEARRDGAVGEILHGIGDLLVPRPYRPSEQQAEDAGYHDEKGWGGGLFSPPKRDNWSQKASSSNRSDDANHSYGGGEWLGGNAVGADSKGDSPWAWIIIVMIGGMVLVGLLASFPRGATVPQVPSSTSEPRTSTLVGQQVYITASDLRLRTGCGTEFPQVIRHSSDGSMPVMLQRGGHVVITGVSQRQDEWAPWNWVQTPEGFHGCIATNRGVWISTSPIQTNDKPVLLQSNIGDVGDNFRRTAPVTGFAVQGFGPYYVFQVGNASAAHRYVTKWISPRGTYEIQEAVHSSGDSRYTGRAVLKFGRWYRIKDDAYRATEDVFSAGTWHVQLYVDDALLDTRAFDLEPCRNSDPIDCAIIR